VVNKKDIDIRTKLWAVNREQFKAQWPPNLLEENE
jgi:hypothetical protein